MRRAILAMMCVALASCESPRLLSSSPRTVVVSSGIPPNRHAAAAQAIADQQCARFGRFARMIARPVYDQSHEYVFDCVQ